MLISQDAVSGPHTRQGSRWCGLSELRRELADPSRMRDGTRQRLLDIHTRLARVQAFGSEYARVGLSQRAQAALAGNGPRA